MEALDPAIYESCGSPHACAAAPIISRKWFPVIVCHLLQGPKRYSELARAIPLISGKVLAENLEFMEGEEILRRNVHGLQPVEVWYQLTQKGMDLATVINAMNVWGERWLKRPTPSRQRSRPMVDVIWNKESSPSATWGTSR